MSWIKKIGDNYINKAQRSFDVQNAIKNGAALNHTENYLFPIQVITIWNDYETFLCAVKHGADINCFDANYNTLLHYSALSSKDNIDIMKYLVENGIDVNYENRLNSLPIHDAVASGERKAIEYLIEQGADINRMNNCCLRPFDYNEKFENISWLREIGFIAGGE